MDKTREEFVTFIRQAINDPKSSAAEELYQFLVACYVRADTNMNGRIYNDMFDTLIEEAAELPRKYVMMFRDSLTNRMLKPGKPLSCNLPVVLTYEL